MKRKNLNETTIPTGEQSASSFSSTILVLHLTIQRINGHYRNEWTLPTTTKNLIEKKHRKILNEPKCDVLKDSHHKSIKPLSQLSGYGG